METPIIPWTPFIPHKPTPKQLAFLLLPHQEAFYGGAVAGGKSDAGLMGALQYVDVPYYSALIIRKTLTDLKQQAALLNRAHEWLGEWIDAGFIKYLPGEHAFVWPNKARLQFGFLGEIGSEERYQSAEFQYIFIDEVLQHYPEHYEYLFSRIRKTKCYLHGGRIIDGELAPLPDEPTCALCQRYAPLHRVPLRMRSAGNPGGMSHEYFVKRFKIKKTADGRWIGMNPEAPFIPATLDDNPHIDRKEYESMLNKMSPIERNRLRFGDWGATDDARFKQRWAVEYERRGDNFILHYRNGTSRMYQLWELILFSVVDPASSVAEGVAGVRFHKNKRPSSTVFATFAVTPAGDLLLLDVIKRECEAPEILSIAKQQCRYWRPSFVLCESNGPGKPIAQFMQQIGIPVRPLWQYNDKVGNSVCAQIRMEQGKTFFPREAPWLEDWNNEVFIWTGHPHERDDQIDVLSNASHMVTVLVGEDQFDTSFGTSSIPEAVYSSTSSPLGTGGYARPY